MEERHTLVQKKVSLFFLYICYHSWYKIICFWGCFFCSPGQRPYLTCVCPYVPTFGFCSMTWVPLMQIIGNSLSYVFDHSTQVMSTLALELCPLIETWLILYFSYSNFIFPSSNIWNFYTMFSITIHTEGTSCFIHVTTFQYHLCFCRSTRYIVGKYDTCGGLSSEM